MQAIINGKIIVERDDGRFTLLEHHVLLFDKSIIQLVPANYFAHSQVDGEIIDAAGLYVSPGFIDTHIHGCGGADTMDEDDTALSTMAKIKAQTGVTSFLPTTMTYDMPRVYRALDRIKAYMENDNDKHIGAKIIGCHMEGPFINSKYKGAQAEKDIIPADFSLIEKYADIVKVITIAPELLSSDSDFIKSCNERGINVSLGHSAAGYEEATDALERGVNRFTHLFNGQMTGMHHRKPGAVGAAMDRDSFVELILDNIHVVPAMQRLAAKVKGLGQLVAITDSMRAAGLGDGESELGGQKVFVKDGKATLADGTIAGSVASMDTCVRNLAQSLNIPVWQAVECATMTVAKSIGMQNEIGRLAEGLAADIVLFDDNVDIKMTIIDGITVYKK